MYRRTLYYVSRCKRLNSYGNALNFATPFACKTLCRPFSRDKKDSLKGTNISSLFVPAPIQVTPSEENDVGVELVGSLEKSDVLKILNKFYQRPEIKALCADNGLDNYLQHQAYLSFRRFCIECEHLPVDLHIVINDILKNAGHITDIFPYFLRHAKQIFPHLECMEDLKKISDLTSPPSWYPNARIKKRKIIFHAGPTNSGKTYHALERFLSASSGVYCGPLKLLATEVYKKSNDRGTPCDLVTGEERKYALGDGNPSSHVSCTVEMTNLNVSYEVAVIDEVQVMRDISRGWAWTRAFLGLTADELHICGETAALELIQSLALTCNEQIEVRRYERLTSLTVESSALGSLDNVQPGDCIVCFSKNDIYTVSRGLESRGKEAAVIYGGLPPGTKLAQAHKFNDPNSSCEYLVATDAIGMGLNLSIRRVIFYSLIKPTLNEKGEKEIDTISISQALQIAGRAGRFNTQYDQGYVTTYKPEDLTTLSKLLSDSPEQIEKAGLHPTAEQIELYAYHLPNATLSNLVSIFEGICTMDDSLYFMCNMDDFKFLADMVQHVPLSLRARYVFCCAPINRRMPFICAMFVKFARLYSRNETISYRWLCRSISTPFSPPKTINDLIHLESVYDVLDLYLWLSNRFADLFPDVGDVRNLQSQLDETIERGVTQITKLLKNQHAYQSQADLESNDEGVSRRDNETISRETQRELLGGPARGRLTDRLMAQGLLTQSMIKQLKKEWIQSISKEDEQDRKPKRITRKRKIY